MNSNRSLLIMGLLLVSFLIFTQWQQDFDPKSKRKKQLRQLKYSNKLQLNQAMYPLHLTPIHPLAHKLAKGKPLPLRVMYYV